MQNPIDRFRDAVNSVSEELRSIVVYNGCFALGRRWVRNSTKESADTPVGDLYAPQTIDDLCDQLRILTTEQGMHLEFLIPGVLQFIADKHERTASPEVADARLNDNLEMLQRLEKELSLPADMRRPPTPTDVLTTMISQLKEGMLRAPKFNEDCKEIASSLRELCQSAFTDKYWDAWEKYSLFGKE